MPKTVAAISSGSPGNICDQRKTRNRIGAIELERKTDFHLTGFVAFVTIHSGSQLKTRMMISVQRTQKATFIQCSIPSESPPI